MSIYFLTNKKNKYNLSTYIYIICFKETDTQLHLFKLQILSHKLTIKKNTMELAALRSTDLLKLTLLVIVITAKTIVAIENTQ